jgi:hypothetical protein
MIFARCTAHVRLALWGRLWDDAASYGKDAMNITAHQLTDLDELRRRIRHEANAKQRDRWRAVLLALEGKTTAAIMDKLGRSKNFVQRWAYFYRDQGLPGVRPLKQPGKRPLLSPDQHAAFLERINNG